jgi:alkane 1-monooxygenase
MVLWTACPLLLAAAAFRAYGWAGVGFMALQAFVAILMLETVNYIEHYGLVRRKLPSGR